MNMNRRNVLLGLGTAAAGSGAVFGSGAFTQIEAKRQLSVSVEGDNSSSVKISPGSAAKGEFVTVEQNSNLTDSVSNTIEFVLNNEDFNSGSTLTVGDVSQGTGSQYDSSSDDEAFFIIEENTNFVTSGSSALGIDVEFSETPSDIDQESIKLDFYGNSDNSSLDAVADSADAGASLDFTSGLSSTAEIADDDGGGGTDTNARFVLSSAQGDYSSLAAAVLTLQTDEDGTANDDVTIRIRAESVDATSATS